MIFAVFDVLLAVNMCINYSFFTFMFRVISHHKLHQVALRKPLVTKLLQLPDFQWLNVGNVLNCGV